MAESGSGWEAQRCEAQRVVIKPRQYEREFSTEVELLYGSGSRGPTFKKVRREKKDSNSRGHLEDPPHKLRERPSANWLSISRQPSSSFSSGSWRKATCNLRDEGGQATLRLYNEDQHFHYSIHINASFAPHLRLVDPSVFSRRHVLAIHDHSPTNGVPSGATNTLATTCEPMYLAFQSRDSLNSWLVLLRSFARPDIRPNPYPVGYAFPQNISYRIWRQIQITILAGRKLANKDIFGAGSSDESNSKESGEKINDRWEGILEVVLNGIVVGRTGFKSLPGPAWSTERITITDPILGGGTWAGSDGVLGVDSPGSRRFGWDEGSQDMSSALLEVRGLRAKSGLFTSVPTISHMGTSPIDLGPFRRGELVKAWWPGFSQEAGEQHGEILMEIKFDEEIVLPLELYSAMKDILIRQNYFELWSELTARIPIPMPVSTHFISLALYHGNLGPQLADLAHAEIHNANTSPSTLFRGNSTMTRIAESAMAILGAQGFLENSLGRVVRDIYRDKIVFESSANGMVGANTGAGVIEGAGLMADWLQKMWDSIWGARDGCPHELRHLFYRIRTQVEARWGSSALHADLKYQAISAFLFLRFFIPALLRPEQHGLVVGPPPEGVERTLKSMARTLQSLANLNTNVQREEFMRSVKTFNEKNVEAMIDYLVFVSELPIPRVVVHSVPPTLSSGRSLTNQAHMGLTGDPSPELQIRTALQARLPSMAALHRESLPILPYMTDEARDFAVIASAVVRNARTAQGLARPLHREIGPMNEGFEGLTEGSLGVSNADIGDEQCSEAAEATGGSQTQVQQDVMRFIKACFDVQAEAMRRVSPNATASKKHSRRRRRPTMEEDGSNPDPPDYPVPARTPSTEESSYDGRDFGAVSSVSSTSGAGTSVGIASFPGVISTSLSADPRPDIVRQHSQNTMSDTKKKNRLFELLTGGRK
ncbi:Ras GTPase activating domain protein [Rhizoctonia solani AG-3 Rhs1AP]|uniref:Ras GTPase activating domain protein n=1 Tax=Rhizoctonia solani AG-3 Rhs1AP TaxID=1086054 RepID=X8IXG3_9AGAM|nr:Ras GTPase activating domain protein [Rhizoctonia solani AG-3 Rhs1AP]